MTTTIYTTGDAGASLAGLVRLAKQLDAIVFDIRMSPASRMAEWNRSAMQAQLGQRYRHVPQLGNRLYKSGGPIAIADMESGTAVVLSCAKPVILLCGCQDAATCHRTVVANHLRACGCEVTETPIPQIGNMIKAVTVYQPFATLIAILAKEYETRHWPTHYRGLLAIHAGKNQENLNICFEAPFYGILAYQGYRDPYDLPFGCIVAVVDMIGCYPTESQHPTEQERAFGDWTPGRYAWQLANVQRLTPPIPARGAQGLWDWEVPTELSLAGKVQP